jgi:2-keto-4-pentenoate hydratase/2-oxohepta-3-ene-1,7-dioic acid hydratase in catechol pathway
MHTVIRENQAVVPSKIVCAGRNYVEHIAELDNEVPTEPVIFVKPNSALSDELRSDGDDIHYEGEISFLLHNGKIDAVGFGLDLTRRAVQTSLKNKAYRGNEPKPLMARQCSAASCALTAIWKRCDWNC